MFVRYKLENEKKAAERDAKISDFVSVQGRVSIGAAVFTIDCELSLWLEEEPHILQINTRGKTIRMLQKYATKYLTRTSSK